MRRGSSRPDGSTWRAPVHETDVLRIAAGEATAEVTAEGVGVLEEAGVLVHPTATVYGLGGGTRSADAEVARLKDRSLDRPLLRIAHDAETFRRERPELRWTAGAERLARRFWPGALTLVLDDGTAEGLAIRVEAHPITRAVLRAWGRTLSSTSLNRSGEPPAARPSEVRAALAAFPRPRVRVGWLDAGELPGGPPSTLVSLRAKAPRLLRAGAVDAGAIEAVLGRELTRG